MTSRELEKMAKVSLSEVRDEDIAYFDEYKADYSKRPEERIRDFLAMGKNPYFRKEKNGKGKVKISFANNGIRLSDALASVLSGV